MRTEEKSHVKNSIKRLALVAIAVLLQIAWLLVQIIKLNRYSTEISLFTSLLAFLLALKIYAHHEDSGIRMTWIIIILVFPIMGVSLYLLIGIYYSTGLIRRRVEKLDSGLLEGVRQDPAVMEQLKKADPQIANQSYYISEHGKWPVYQNTETVFYPDAAAGLEAQKEALRRAEHFIFMEYHAIEEAEAFGELKEILAERAAHGVEVRILYDDVGSVGFINTDFIRRMTELGIQCRVFNPLVPIMSIFMNNRDHRKITVIDNKVGFTGGYNLADEYFNITHPYGVWKDTGIRLEGDAVHSLTVSFLELWNVVKNTDTDYSIYLKKESGVTAADDKTGGVPEKKHSTGQGYVQPYSDNPLDDERLGENVYLNMAKGAKKYLYAMTPYLIISEVMASELILAAKRGIDVRIITPGIPDKKIIYKITRSYYGMLVKHGIRIYEYTPGFCHAKQWVCDDETAVVGTINMDYRSLYHHFENGVFLYNCDAVADIRRDFEETFAQCEEVTEKYRRRSNSLRVWQCVLRLFAPLL